jgi:hypothetical protein
MQDEQTERIVTLVNCRAFPKGTGPIEAESYRNDEGPLFLDEADRLGRRDATFAHLATGKFPPSFEKADLLHPVWRFLGGPLLRCQAVSTGRKPHRSANDPIPFFERSLGGPWVGVPRVGDVTPKLRNSEHLERERFRLPRNSETETG